MENGSVDKVWFSPWCSFYFAGKGMHFLGIIWSIEFCLFKLVEFDVEGQVSVAFKNAYNAAVRATEHESNSCCRAIKCESHIHQ